MRTVILVALISIFTGTAVGIGHSLYDLGQVWEPQFVVIDKESGLAFPPASSPQPKAIFDETEHNFGTMERGMRDKHIFRVRNVGDGPLELKVGESTCKCTVGALKSNVIAPGDSTEVTLEWEARQPPGLFRQAADIFTNDRTLSKVTLSVLGTITKSVDVVPAEVIVGRISTDQSRVISLRLLGQSKEPIHLRTHEFTNQETAQFFTVEAEPLSEAQLSEAGVASGDKITVTLKPGMPPGPINQKLRLLTNLEHLPAIEVPITGYIAGDISIVGRGWSESLGTLTLGTIHSEKGLKRILNIRVTGDNHGDVKFTVAKTTPDYVKAELGEPRLTQGGETTQIPLTIEIPPGVPSVNYLTPLNQKIRSEVIINTTHPSVKTIQFELKFAVER